MKSMSNKKIWFIKNSKNNKQIEEIEKAVQEEYDYIVLCSPETENVNLEKLKEKIKETKIPIILYSDKISKHDKQLKEIMGSVRYVITGLQDSLTDLSSESFTSNFNKMIIDLIENNKNKAGD